MAFNFVEKKFTKLVDNIQSKNTIKSEDVKSFLKEIRLLLLEADVNLDVVKSFISRIEEGTIGSVADLDKTKSQELIKIVNQELTKILGGETSK
jgi:signal recognition particle subunit SRP54